MVNTFLTSRNWYRSAQRLDNKRLFKQCVEAWQIYLCIRNLHLLAQVLNLQLSASDPIDLRIQRIIHTYKSSPYKLAIVGDVVSSDKMEVTASSQSEFKLIPWAWERQHVPVNWRIVSTAFLHHPAVAMWFDAVEALKYYFNVHLQAWFERKADTTTRFTYFEVNVPFDLPFWYFDQRVYVSHRSSLMLKKREWYIQYGCCAKAPSFTEYFWPTRHE